MLFSEPLKATLDAEKSYREVWVEWLTQTQKLIPANATGPQQAAMISERLDIAPTMKFEAAIDAAVTMRLVSVKSKTGEGKLGLAVGPFQVSGSFGFTSSSTSESILEARARYQLSNTNEATLRGWLEAAGIDPTTRDSLDDAKARLQDTEE